MNKIVFSILIAVGASCFADGPNNTHTSNGRYQLIQLSSMRSDQYLLDTQTGKIWERVCLKPGNDTATCKLAAWTVDNVEGITVERNQLEKAIGKQAAGD